MKRTVIYNTLHAPTTVALKCTPCFSPQLCTDKRARQLAPTTMNNPSKGYRWNYNGSLLFKGLIRQRGFTRMKFKLCLAFFLVFISILATSPLLADTGGCYNACVTYGCEGGNCAYLQGPGTYYCDCYPEPCGPVYYNCQSIWD
jgi:hypothetical protein